MTVSVIGLSAQFPRHDDGVDIGSGDDRRGATVLLVGDAAYAAEEFVAEIASAFLCSELASHRTADHEQYFAQWLELMKDGNRAIFAAASF
jgi:antirestriction protein ArdC